MPDILFTFDDLRLVDGAAVTASGEADINYDHCTFAVGEIRLDPDDAARAAGGAPVVVEPQHPLFLPIYKAIRARHDDIWAQATLNDDDIRASREETRADFLNDMARG
jgi:hypothetical protein